MKIRALPLIVFMLSVFCAAAYEVRDARGKLFSFDEVPTAATVVPSVTQNIFAIGADSRLIANSRYCVYPAGANEKVKIGGFIDPDYEKIAELKPQIFILPWSSNLGIQERLESLGIKCFVLNRESLENIAADIRMLGKLFQAEVRAEKVASEIEAEVKKTPECAGGEKPRAVFVFGNMAAGKGSYVGDLINACGLENIADAAEKPWPVLSREFIVSSAPEILFVEFADEAEKSSLRKFYEGDSVWRATPAVKNGRVYFVPRDLVGIPGPRVTAALRLMREFCGLQTGSARPQ